MLAPRAGRLFELLNAHDLAAQRAAIAGAHRLLPGSNARRTPHVAPSAYAAPPTVQRQNEIVVEGPPLDPRRTGHFVGRNPIFRHSVGKRPAGDRPQMPAVGAERTRVGDAVHVSSLTAISR